MKKRVVANPRMPEIVESLNRLSHLTDRQERMLSLAKTFQEYIMRSLQEVVTDMKAENAKLRQLIQDDQAGDQATLDAAIAARDAATKLSIDLQAEVDRLNKLIADGQPVDTTELEKILADSKELEALITPIAEQPKQPDLPPGETEVPPGAASLGGA